MADTGFSPAGNEERPIHQPVLVSEVLSTLACRPLTEKVYLDCTLGLGGHAEAILKATGPHGKVIGMDRDEEALRLAEERLSAYSDRLIVRKGSFKELLSVVRELHVDEVDGVLFDFGVSSFQLDDPERGFSFQRSGPLDMRMDRRQKETAADWINRRSQSELSLIIQQYGEERFARRIASAILRHREEQGIITRTEELEGIIWRAVPPQHRHGRIHPATRTFQAIRMAVNEELEQIEAGLEAALSLLAVGGRAAVLSFHSLEDRCAKQTIKKWTAMGKGEEVAPGHPQKTFLNLYKKPVRAGLEEIKQNPRARSAKLRGLERAA